MSDQLARQQALDITQSFIVQAPAGSGKTGLLTQRLLKLLAHVKSNPEEILAITFTRKAAHEMRVLVLDAITMAKKESEGLLNKDSLSPHDTLTLELARAVYLRDQTHQWRLLEQPHRLRLMTIDSLCAFLTRQMPVSSRLGGHPK